MCGRYTLFDIDQLEARFRTENSLRVAASFNVAPGAEMPTISRQSPNRMVLRRWGLVPFWAKDPRVGYKLINARGETVGQKPAFRKAIRSQRCLVPADGFYEWKRVGERKQPFYIRLKSKATFGMAGIYDIWEGAGKFTIESYSIITTKANKLMRGIHERMPVIIKPKDEATWLDPKTPLSEALVLLRPFPGSQMEAFEVSAQVNNARNNTADLIQPIA